MWHSRTSGHAATVVSKAADGSMQLRREPIPALPEELKQVIEEMAK